MVSIIIPVYNVSLYIQDCLESIAKQSYTDLEVILVDDCGSDGSINVALNFISNYCGSTVFRILHHEHNRGLSAARNTGLRGASGEFVYFLDSDDWISPDCIDGMMKCVDIYPDAEIVFAGAVPSPYLDKFKWMNIENKDLPLFSNNPLWIKTSMLQRLQLSMTAWNRLIRREFLLNNNLFFYEGYTHEDELWNFQLAKFAERIAIYKRNTYFYRIRENGIICSENVNTRVTSLIDIWTKMCCEIDSVLPEIQSKMIWNHISETFYNNDLQRVLYKKELELLLFVKKYFSLSEKVVLYLYTRHRSLFLFFMRIPKLRGYIKNKMTIINTFSPTC